MVYYSQAWQDEFVANILNFKKGGYYLDIGSGVPNAQSNTYFFDSELNWKGVCVERGSDYNVMYADKRTCHFINDDATKIDYKTVLDTNVFPSKMDYLSVDIDENSALALKQLPLDNYRFSVITIEHDSYRFDDSLKNEERNILSGKNYRLLLPDVLVPLGCGMGPNLSFEDWWVDPTVFDMDKLHPLSGARLYPDDIVATLKKMAGSYFK